MKKNKNTKNGKIIPEILILFASADAIEKKITFFKFGLFKKLKPVYKLIIKKDMKTKSLLL